MSQWLSGWDKRLSRWLWWVVIVGVIAALPVMYARAETEASDKEVAIVIDYRDLEQVSSTQLYPQQFVQEQLDKLKEAGANSAAVFESTLEELVWAGEINVYNATNGSMLTGKVSPPEDNRTYVVFNNPAHESILRPIIEWAFTYHGADIKDWSVDGYHGLSLGMAYEDAMIRPMQPNPIAMKALKEQGFNVIPRLSNRFEPFDAEEVAHWVKSFEELGVTWVLFDGDAVTGFNEKVTDLDEPEESDGIVGTGQDGVRIFADLLQERGIGITIFENMKVQQKGINKLAKLINYEAIRGHSIGESEMSMLKEDVLEDRLVLAVKDRNIRLLYLNMIAGRDTVRGKVYHPVDKIVEVLAGDEDKGSVGVVKQLEDFGYKVGNPHSFDITTVPQEKVLRGLAMLGAIALVALMIGLFIPVLTTISFVVGAVGAAGLYVLRPFIMEQALALFVGIAAPTVAVVFLVKKLNELRASSEMSVGKRLWGTALLFVRTTVLSLLAVPFIVALLNDITYNLVIQQFRGVSALHLIPIGLVAIYVLLYGSGQSPVGNAKRILAMPINVLWIVAIGIAGAAGYYYLSRTGNAGQVSGLELQFRSMLENLFGVRPRTKEFLLGHPLFIAGIFLALRYRWSMALIIAGTIAQLSMVDTFAHIHTPVILSGIRVLLGLGLGVIISIIVIVVWQLAEKLWRRILLRRSEA
ncbi:MAG: DUF5693 family protein [Candidatus Cohnella colombiensis]|uniref:DUF5693 family protein n=1 Tax=Candidatus Cohnella colombiensis TaxID=3121368 RepID=A0AA95EV35_9BACL|nr:MAG: DUF5693 family protein [Cohnella sp.]